MMGKIASSEATAKLCLPSAITLDRRALENALIDLDQAVAADDHFGYEMAFQAILTMIPQSSATPADDLEDHEGPHGTSPEALAEMRFAARAARGL